MVCEPFLFSGVGEYIQCKELIYPEKYINILEKEMLPIINNIVSLKSWAAIIFQYVQLNWRIIRYLERLYKWCPDQCSDLNLVETIWTVLKQNPSVKMFANENMPLEAIKNLWRDISIEQCKKQTDSIPKEKFKENNLLVNLSYLKRI